MASFDKWTERWTEAEACMLSKILTPTQLDAHQIEGFYTRYKNEIAFLLDGIDVGLRTARKNSLLTRTRGRTSPRPTPLRALREHRMQDCS